MSSSSLKIKLLGPVEISYQGEILEVKRRMERAILYFLAVEHRPISRTTLIDMLWPDAENVDTRRAMRTALSRLRKELPDPDLLITELDQVWLDIDRCQIDLLKFEELFRSLHSVLSIYHNHRTLPSQIVKQINEALSVWHGNTVIDGDNLTAYPQFEHWRRSLDQNLSYQRRFFMRTLADHYRAAGQLESALELFFSLGRMDPLDVGIQLSILEILTSLGRNQDSVEYCDSLEIIYEREYNAPLPDQILSEYQYAKIQLKASTQQEPEAWPTAFTMQLQLVGRAQELDQLREAFFQGGLAIVRGEIGSGKTRLVQELYQSLSPSPKLFLASAIEMENSLPLSPIIHCLRRHVRENTWREIDAVWANQMVLLLPELTEIRNDLDTQNVSILPAGKQNLFDAIYNTFHHIARKSGKVLFFLDDGQWADNQTIQALSYMVQHGFFDSHGLLVIASRPEETNDDLDKMIDRFQKASHVNTITLNGLSPNDLGALAQQVLTDPPSPSFISQLYRETNGNPFLALEIIRNILELGGEIETYTNRLPLPESVHALIRKRLRRLDQDSRYILQCAAVLGSDFSLETLLAIADIDPTSNSGAIDPLVNAGFIHPIHKGRLGTIHLQFVHEKMREGILKETTPMRLQILHRMAADKMAEIPQMKDKAAVIAHHYLASGNPRAAFNWFIKAAEVAMPLGAKEEVFYAYQQAEKLFINAPEGSFETDELFRLYRPWSEFAYQTGRSELLEEIGIKLQILGERDHNPLVLGISQIALANACFLRLKMSTGLELIEKAIQYLEHTDDPLIKIQAILRQGAFQWWENDFDKSLQAGEKVLDMLDSLEIDSPMCNSYLFNARNMIGMSRYAKGEAKNALHYAQQTFYDYYHTLSAFDRIRLLQMMAYTNLLSSNYHQVEDFTSKGLKISQALENNFIYENLTLILGEAEVIQGNLDQAYDHINQALNSAEKSRNTHTVVGANSLLGDIYCMLQSYSKALQHYRVSQIRAGFANNSMQRLKNDVHLARLLGLMGHPSEAREILTYALDVTEQTGMKQLHTKALMISGFCSTIEGNFTLAEDHLGKAERIAELNGLKYEWLWVKTGQSRIALSKHQFELAANLINIILDESQEINSVWHQLHGLQLCAEIHKATQQPKLLEYQAMFKTLIKKIEAHTQSDPLRQDFINARRYWEEGHHYP